MVRFESLLFAALSFGSLALGGISASSEGQNQRLKRVHDHSNLAHRRHLKNDSGAPLEPLRLKRANRRCKPRTTTSTSTRIPNNVASPSEKATTTKAEPAAPTKTHHEQAPAKTTHKAAAPTKGASHGGASWLSGVQSGDGTYYNIEGGYTACGNQPSDSDYIAAVSHLLFDAYPGATANPNLNPICGKKVTAFRGGKSVTVTIVDRCTGCKVTDLDFTPAAFNRIADASLGRVPITWQWA